MMDGDRSNRHDKLDGHEVVIRGNYEIFVVALLVIQLVNSILILSLGDTQVERTPIIFGFGISLYLMGDAIFRLVRSPDRRRFMSEYRGYLVLLGSLPIPFACFFWLWWYRLLARKLRRADLVDVERVVVHKRGQSTLLAVILAATIVLEVSSIAVVYLEQYEPSALIVTADDAIWWSLVTMATVGYGDMYPVTVGGRFVAVFVMIIGVTLFTVLTSYLSQNLMRHRNSMIDLTSDADMPADIVSSLDAISQLLDQHEYAYQDSMNELRARLKKLERMIEENADGQTGRK